MARDADYLVVGSANKNAVKRALLGSVSHYCVRHAPCPVVVVPHGQGVNHVKIQRLTRRCPSRLAEGAQSGRLRCRGALSRAGHERRRPPGRVGDREPAPGHGSGCDSQEAWLGFAVPRKERQRGVLQAALSPRPSAAVPRRTTLHALLRSSVPSTSNATGPPCAAASTFVPAAVRNTTEPWSTT
jgi:hypothetical protein